MERHDRWGAVGIGLAALVLYLITLCPAVTWHDSAEFVGAAVNLGVPHAPGYPLYVLLGHGVVHLLPLSPPVAIHVMNAMLGAVGVGLLFALLRRLGAGRPGAATGAALLGVSQTWWSESIIAEVHAPAVVLLLGVVLLLVSAVERKSQNRAILAAMLAGLGLGAHYFIATAGLGLVVLALSVVGGTASWSQAIIARARLGLACLGGVMLGSLIFLYVPIRQAALFGPEMLRWDRILFWFQGGSFQTWFTAPPAVERSVALAGMLSAELTIPGLCLALFGVARLWRGHALMAVALPLICLGNIGFFFNYLQSPSPEFYLPSIAVLAGLAGMGADGLVRFFRVRCGSLAPVLLSAALPLWLLAGNFHAVDRSGDTVAEEYAAHLVQEIPEGAILVSYMSDEEWTYHAVFRDYVQGVQGLRKDVLLWPLPDYLPLLKATRGERPVYLYYPVPGVEERFILEKECHLYRVVGPRQTEPDSPRAM